MAQKIKEPQARFGYRRNTQGVWEPLTSDITVGLPVGLVKIFNDSDCGGTTAVTSPIFYIGQCGYFGLWLQCKVVGAGVIAVSLTFQQSYALDGTFVAPEGAGTILAIADANAHVVGVNSIAPAPMPYIKFIATGTGVNDATTKIIGYLFAQ